MTGGRVLVKICGLTRPEDCLAVNRAGADYAGFVFAPSRRQVTPDKAREFVRLLADRIEPVGIFVDETDAEINTIVCQADLQVVQLHGAVAAGRIGRLRRLLPAGTAIWQRLPVPLDCPAAEALADAADMVRLIRNGAARDAVDEIPDAWLLDSCQIGQSGGTGQSFDWPAFQDFCRSYPTILAGGLNVDNIGQALQQLQLIAVDCSSGVETGGLKDPAKISHFCQMVQNRRGGICHDNIK